MDVVPIAVCGTRNVLKRGAIFIKPFPIELRIGKPLNIKSSKNLSLAWMSPDELLIFTYSEVFHKKIKKGLDEAED